MSSREKILSAVKANQPANITSTATTVLSPITYADKKTQFKTVLENIGGSLLEIKTYNDISLYVKEHFREGHHLVSTIANVAELPPISQGQDPHELEVVEFALLPAQLGVAENGSVWLTGKDLQVRVIAFICQHLAVVLNRKDIVNNMHEAYARIGNLDYDFGVFIAGPSKTADIEQSLVLGAHGPRSMTVFLLDD